MRPVFICILFDPRKPEMVRYVGQTLTPHSRHIQHCCETGQSPKCEWIEVLRRDGVMPQMTVLEETTEDKANERERLWIARFNLGDLVNKTASAKTSTKIAPEAPKQEQKAPEAKQTLQTISGVERDTILAMLKTCGGNKLETSRRLGIGRQTLYNKLKSYQQS